MAKQLQTARAKAWKRQRGLCYYCGENVPKHKATLDHRIPRALGGNLQHRNGVMACAQCNQAKGCLDPAEFFARLCGQS